MDFGDLDDVLDEGSYIPSFARETKPKETKNLNKNSSNKSIESEINLPPQQQNPSVSSQRSNMLQIHKQTRQDVTTFEEFIKNQNQKTLPKQELRKQQSIENRHAKGLSRKDFSKDELDINNILDQADSPVASRRNMKPPLSKKGDDGRSVASRRNDDNPSIASRSDNKWMSKDGDKLSANNKLIPQVSYGQGLHSKQVSKDFTTSQIISKVDISQFKKILDEQLDSQRKFSERIMIQQKNIHKAQIQRIKNQYQEELKRKIGLKDLQINNMKENYELKIKTIYQNISDSQNIQNASNQLQEGIRALQKAQAQFKNRSNEYAEKNSSNYTFVKSFENLSSQKQRTIKEMLKKIEAKQAQFKEEKLRSLGQIERDKRKNQQNQRKLSRKEQQLEQKYTKKERMMLEQWERKNQKLVEDQHSLRKAKSFFEEEKIKFQQEKADSILKIKQWQQSKAKFLEQIQIQKTKNISKEIQINSRQNQIELRSSQIQFKEKQIQGRIKLIQMERKKWDTERDTKKKNGGNLMFKTGAMNSRLQQQLGSSIFQKSLKQLKQQYLRNIGHF